MIEDADAEAEWNPLNVKEAYTDFGSAAQRSALEARYPRLMECARDDETAITYNPKMREFGLPVLDGGSSVIAISHDPWSGEALPSSLRHRWFDDLEALGLDPSEDEIPLKYQAEDWWLEEGL